MSMFRSLLDFFTAPARREQALRAAVAGQKLLDALRHLDFLPPLLIRLYLAPLLWMAGTYKVLNFSDTADWLGSSLELPTPMLLAVLLAATEVLGALSLGLGLAVRWVSLPLLTVIAVAAFKTPPALDEVWLAISNGDGLFTAERNLASLSHTLLLLVLLFTGAGRYVSVDYWLRRRHLPDA